MASPSQPWKECELGLIEGMVARQHDTQSLETRRRAIRMIAVGGVGCLAAFIFASSRGSKSVPGSQIACEKVHENLQDFVDEKIADRYLRGMISSHLFVCAECQKAYQGMIDGADFSCEAEQQA